MWRCSCTALLLSALLLLWCGAGGADSKPLLGLLSLLGATNGTSLVDTLLLNHVQNKINALEVIADLIAIASNSTG